MLTVSMTVVISILMSLVTVLDIRRERDLIRDSLVQRGRLLAEGLNDALANQLYYTQIDSVRDIAELVRSEPEVQFVRVFGPDGMLLVSGVREDKEFDHSTGYVDAALATSPLQSQQIRVTTKGDEVELTSPIIIGDTTIGFLQLGFNSEILRAEIRSIILSHVWQGLALVAVGFVLIYFFSRYVTKPLRALADAAREIGESGLDVAIPIEGSNETTDLGLAMVRMRDELEGLYAGFEQQVTDRTMELEETAQELRCEINRRNEAETALQDSVHRLEVAYEQAKRTSQLLLEEMEERKRAEEERRQLEVKALAQSKLATIGQVATGLAHEINQPLTYISTITQVVQEDIRLGEIDHQRFTQQLSECYRQVGRIIKIVQHLRAFGRADEMEMGPVSVEDVVDNAMLLMGERLRLSDVHLESSIVDDLPRIRGNAYQLEQVFINFFQNSLDAVEGRTSGAEITISASVAGQLVRVQFSDNGVGIPPEHIDHIFDPFFTTKPVGEGTGLGLSVVYGIIRDHGGTIACSTELGKGTTFVIHLQMEVT